MPDRQRTSARRPVHRSAYITAAIAVLPGAARFLLTPCMRSAISNPPPSCATVSSATVRSGWPAPSLAAASAVRVRRQRYLPSRLPGSGAARSRPPARTPRRHAAELGAAWTGGADSTPPRPLDCAFPSPPLATCAAHPRITPPRGHWLSTPFTYGYPALPYASCRRRALRSVANATRQDAYNS